MSEQPSLPQNVIDAFHLMWGSFPEPVTLTHRSFQVMAVNRAAVERGLQPGIFCNKIGTPDMHKGCKAQKCVREGKSQYLAVQLPDHEAVGFWLAVEGHPDFFIHVTVGASLNYKTGEPVNIYTSPVKA